MDFVVVWITWVLLHFSGSWPVTPACGLHTEIKQPQQSQQQSPQRLINQTVVGETDKTKTSSDPNGYTFSGSKYINGHTDTYASGRDNSFVPRASAAEFLTNPPRLQPLNGPPVFINGHNDDAFLNGKEVEPNQLDGKGVMETQHATCQITTEQLVATAEATVTRVLSNFCNSKEMEGRFAQLESVLAKHITELKDTVLRLETRINEQKETLNSGQQYLAASLAKKCRTEDETHSTVKSNSGGTTENKQHIHVQDIKVKTLKMDDTEKLEIRPSTRDPEILKYNSTIHLEPSATGQKRVFTYYWRLQNIQEKMRDWEPLRSIRSQSFNIYPAGYRMYLRIYPRQDGDKFFIHVGITKGDFDKDLKWPFSLKHRVSVLDQARDLRMQEDITSRVWDPTQLCSEFNWQKPTQGDNHECVGLGFPQDVLRQRDYISNDSVVVKLTVYLP